MEEELDLDINNYTIKDLERFFGLNGNSSYTAKDVESREYKIREQLLSSGHINKRFKRNLIFFLETGKRWILTVKFPPKAPSSIPSNYPLDPLNNTPPSKELPTSRAPNVIQKPPTYFVHAKNDEYYQGMLNPLENRIITKCVNIDTRFRENIQKTVCSDFTIQLPFKLQKVVSMQLSSIELPMTYYGISSYNGNHFFKIGVTTISNVVYSKIIQISDGNYNANDLIEKINAKLHENSDIFNALEFVLDISTSGSGTGKVSLNKIVGHMEYPNIQTMSLDFNTDIQGNFSTQELSTKIGWNLGFTKSMYEGEDRYVAESIIEPNNTRYLFLAIEDFQHSVNNHFISAFENSVLNPNILARITVKNSYFTILMENDLNIVTQPRKYFGPVDLQRFRVRLLDEYGRVVNMNGANFSFCLNFKLMYE
jgi:hypothetical protein